MTAEVSIRVQDLGKCYHIYEHPRDRLKQFIVPRLYACCGQQHPGYFRTFWALRGVCLEVRKGETVGIIGRNGSGKSTLLQLVCGTLSPTTGTVTTLGRVAALLELGSGFNADFTGRENVFMNSAILGLAEDETRARFAEIAAFAEIGEFMEQPVKTYSSGMMVRLAFAVQAMVEPDVLIIDEALAVGDEKFQRKCFARIEELKSRGTSILFVSHSGGQVVELCDRAVLLEHGECLMQGSPAQVVRSYQRLIYAPPAEQVEIVNQLRHTLSASRAPLRPAEGSPGQFREAAAQDQTIAPRVLVEALAAPGLDMDHSEVGFDPNLKPSTTTRYPEQGARIDGIEIRDRAGRPLNLLTPGEDYQFIVRGAFQRPLERVFFGVHIRSISGMVITGQRFPAEGSSIDLVHRGAHFEVRFEFSLTLLPDVYFAGAGIWSQDPACAHRVLDATMFRVLPGGPRRSFGYCDLAAGPAALVLD